MVCRCVRDAVVRHTNINIGDWQGIVAVCVTTCRCRFLEETGCASICVNACKIPTQEFFATEMGITVALEPNYDDFSCQYSFGKAPKLPSEDDVFTTPCFAQCPSKRHARQQPLCETVTPEPSK
jgi:hypothetical protein